VPHRGAAVERSARVTAGGREQAVSRKRGQASNVVFAQRRRVFAERWLGVAARHSDAMGVLVAQPMRRGP